MALKVSRRAFIFSAVGSSLALGAGAWWTHQVLSTSNAEIIASIVRERLDYLQLDAGGLHAFGTDAYARLTDGGKKRLWWMKSVSPIDDNVDLLELFPMPEKFNQLEERLARRFLMSSDFFSNNADQKRKIRYVGYYDPYENPCGNPFATFEKESPLESADRKDAVGQHRQKTS